MASSEHMFRECKKIIKMQRSKIMDNIMAHLEISQEASLLQALQV